MDQTDPSAAVLRTGTRDERTSISDPLRTPQILTYSADRRNDHFLRHSHGKVRKSFLDHARPGICMLSRLLRLNFSSASFAARTVSRWRLLISKSKLADVELTKTGTRHDKPAY